MNNPYLLKAKKRSLPSSPPRVTPQPKISTSASSSSSSSGSSTPFLVTQHKPLVTPPTTHISNINSAGKTAHRTTATTTKNTTSSSSSTSSSSQSAAGADASALIISASSAKAGMDGIDRARIDAILLQESGNSKFMQQQRRRDDKVNERIQLYHTKRQAASPNDYAITPALEHQLNQWQTSQPTRSTCVVVDMDMFYFACEALNRPDLKDVPACVGHGMILTSNYPARRFGVRSAMPGWLGDKLVEELTRGTQRLIHLHSNFELYQQKSLQMLEALREFDPYLKSYSLDEAYLDLGPYLALFLQQQQQKGETTNHHHPDGSFQSTDLCAWDHHSIVSTLSQEQTQQRENPSSYRKSDPAAVVLRAFSNVACRHGLEQIVLFLRRRVETNTGGLTCSAGMAPNVSLAKIASDFNKPNGQCFVDPLDVLEFVRPLAVRKIPGIGRVTEKILNAHDITTVQDLYDHRGLVNWMFPPATRDFLLKASIGCMGSSGSSNNNNNHDDLEDDDHAGNYPSNNEPDHQKGISRERTFQPHDCWTTLNGTLDDIARRLSQDMIRKKVLAHTVTMKVKLHDFHVYSRSKSMKRGVYIQTHPELIAVATSLLAQIRSEHFATKKDGGGKHSFSCRLLGIRCSNLVEEDDVSSTPKETIEKFLFSVSAPPPSTTTTAHSPFNRTRRGSMCMDHCGDNSAATKGIPAATNQKPWITPNHHRTSSPDSSHNAVIECPLCRRPFLDSENSALNQHIDSCLSGSTVRQVVREITEITSSRGDLPTKKRQRLTDWWVQ